MKTSPPNSPPNQPPPVPPATPDPPANLPLPGMAAIALWMLGLAVLGVFGVLRGHYPAMGARTAILALCTVFAAGGLGLIRLRRWGWALTLAACFLSMCFGFYSTFRFHQTEWIVMAAINMVFFLYLIRPEILARLR